MLVAAMLVACLAPTPQVIEKKVIETVEVVKEVPVEKIVRETVVVEVEKKVERPITVGYLAPELNAFHANCMASTMRYDWFRKGS